jgi:hypothetical protein
MMFATIIDWILYSARNPMMWVVIAFHLWMFVDAIRREEWIWAAFIFFFPMGINAILYYFWIYRANVPANAPTFELPGSANRARIKELQAQIYHLDKAHHHAELANVYFTQGKLADAEKEYLAALERDPTDLDTRAHYGQLLLRLNRAEEARAILEKVCAESPHHDYGQTMMHYGASLAAAGRNDEAIGAYRRTLERNTYPQARVELAELLLAKGDKDAARAELQEVVNDHGHAVGFQRKRERRWVKRASALLKASFR